MDLNLRAADADRERTVAELGRHAAAGRLTLDEFDQRAQAAYAAHTMGDLAALTADLPALEPETPSARPATPPALRYAFAAVVFAAALLGAIGIAMGLAMADGMAGMTGMMGGMAGGCG